MVTYLKFIDYISALTKVPYYYSLYITAIYNHVRYMYLHVVQSMYVYQVTSLDNFSSLLSSAYTCTYVSSSEKTYLSVTHDLILML